jgi:hypothetical protein
MARKFFAPREIQIEGDKAVFMKDPNEGWRWACDVNDGKAVYEAGGKREGWSLMPAGLSEFLTHHALDELVSSPTAWKMTARDVGNSVMSVIDDIMEEVIFEGWAYPYPGGRIFLGQALVAQIFPAISDYRTLAVKEGLFDVAVGATDLRRLSAFDSFPNVEWFRRRPDLLPSSDWPGIDY